jgi:hypothetical protein
MHTVHTPRAVGWWFRWLYYFNPSAATYTLQGLNKNEFAERHNITNTKGLTNGRQFLAQRGWNDDEGEKLDKWACVGIVWVFALMWVAIGQWAFINKRHGSR